ncbi:hypothetical protein FE633_17300 [Streptomyces montanus]|uniref:Uncharacterized protein n=1 Tax=Streptomyces montanus TaxID=2580423 RepID=A0A5R9FWP5_9ACTN|nr:hypothetical protein [Streptomyces montanus]TLS44904.1 hypothetical protein FE633_17300 [Streptomyces montanus]
MPDVDVAAQWVPGRGVAVVEVADVVAEPVRLVVGEVAFGALGGEQPCCLVGLRLDRLGGAVLVA